MKKAAVINDLSGFGRCSLTAAIPVLSTLKIQCCPLATAVLTGQTGYSYYHCTDLTAMIPEYTKAWKKNNAEFDAIYTGFLTGPAQVRHVLDFILQFRSEHTFLTVDPVMGDNGCVYDIYSRELLEGMKTLSRTADLITPNLTEACLLADEDPDYLSLRLNCAQLISYAEKLAMKLRNMADRKQNVVITGIKCNDHLTPVIYNIAVTDDGITKSNSHYFDRSFSGTGDLFASVLCGCLMQDMELEDSIRLAEDFLYQSIKDTLNDDISANDGINFEKYLDFLWNGVKKYVTKHNCKNKTDN